MNTTQTDTPETDAEVERLRLLRYHCAPQNDPKLGADFARKLERARDTALRELAEAKKEIQILSKDKERLDWLEIQGCGYNWSWTDHNGNGYSAVFLCRNTSCDDFTTARQAIDAAKDAQ